MKEKMKIKLKNKFLGINEPSGDRQKSLVILLIGLVLMASLFLYLKISQNNASRNNTNETINFLSLDEIFNKYNNGYKYSITINDNVSKVYYKGSIVGEENTGKRIIDDQAINYKINNDVAVNVETGEEIEDFYMGYYHDLFSLKQIYDYISRLIPTEKVKNNYKTYSYKSINKNIELDINLTTSIESIEEINYNYNNITYNIKISL